ncbi:MAG TPA: polysaccharide deacetylase family protein [Candidatus Dormibacteraeota bacterium]
MPTFVRRHLRHTARGTRALVVVLALAVLSVQTAASAPPAASGGSLGARLDQVQAPAALPFSVGPGVPIAAPELPRLTSNPQLVSAAGPRGPRLTVPILVYHYVLKVRPSPGNVLLFNLSISPALFARQMALLHVEGATPISLAVLIDALNGKGGLPPHPVVLTFDDGYVDFATAAAPVLHRYGFVATDYVVSGFIGHSGYMSAAQVKRMDAAGLVIGSHTVHHVDLATTPPALARMEIDGGKAALEKLLGHRVLDFAYPYGGFDGAVQQMVRDAGFRDAVTTMGGDTQTLAGSFELLRMHIGGAPSLEVFARLAGLPLPTATDYAAISRETSPSRLAELAA